MVSLSHSASESIARIGLGELGPVASSPNAAGMLHGPVVVCFPLHCRTMRFRLARDADGSRDPVRSSPIYSRKN
jgi:hypothetical protein